MEHTKYRIVNKSKDGLKVKIGNHVVSATWDEFNRDFTIEDSVWAVPNKEFIERREKIDDIVTQLTILALKQTAGTITLDELAAVGGLTTKACELSGLAPIQILEIVKSRVASFSGLKHRLPHAKVGRRIVEPGPRTASTSNTKKATLGDHPEFEKLKKLFQ